MEKHTAKETSKKRNLKIKVKLQVAPRISSANLPKIYDFKKWIKAALNNTQPNQAIITIRLVAKDESAVLNWRYRKKKGPTNILSFAYNLPSNLPSELKLPLHGDLVICIPIVRQEATKEHKNLKAHCAHLTIHGILHILGYDHNSPLATKIMEDLEIKILEKLHISNPYAEF